MKRISLFTLLVFLCCGLQAGFAQKKQRKDSNRKTEDRRQNDRWDRDDDDDRRDRDEDDDDDDRKRRKNDRDNGRWVGDDDESENQRGEDYGMRLYDASAQTRARKTSGKKRERAKEVADPEQLGDERAAQLAAAYEIRDERKQKKLQSACSKYFKAKALLAKDFPQKNHRDRKRREEKLEQEYSKELREILPQS